MDDNNLCDFPPNEIIPFNCMYCCLLAQRTFTRINENRLQKIYRRRTTFDVNEAANSVFIKPETKPLNTFCDCDLLWSCTTVN